MWKKILESSRPQMIRRLRTTRWEPKATNTRSEYAIGISLTLQHWLHEGASVLRYTYIDCLVFHSWFFRGKAARTFMNIISSPPTLQNNPLTTLPTHSCSYCLLPCRPITTNAAIFCVVVWNKLYSEACFFHECVICHGFERKEENPRCLSLARFMSTSRLHETQRVMTVWLIFLTIRIIS